VSHIFINRIHDFFGHLFVPVGHILWVVRVTLEVLDKWAFHRGNVVFAVKFLAILSAFSRGKFFVDGGIELEPLAVQLGLPERMPGQFAVTPNAGDLFIHKGLVGAMKLLETDARWNVGRPA